VFVGKHDGETVTEFSIYVDRWEKVELLSAELVMDGSKISHARKAHLLTLRRPGGPFIRVRDQLRSCMAVLAGGGEVSFRGRRLIDTHLPERGWWSELETPERLAFVVITLLCDNVGVWHVNKKLAEFMVGTRVDWSKLGKGCNGNMVFLREGVVWLRDYCRFQYGHIEANSNVHESYRKMAAEEGVLDLIRQTYTLPVPLANPSPTLALPLVKSRPTQQEEEEEKEKEEEESSLSSGAREENSEDVGEGVEDEQGSGDQVRAGDGGGAAAGGAGHVRHSPIELSYDFTAGVWVNLSDEQVDQWIEAFPAVNVPLQLNKAAAWLDANPKQRKSNYARFMFNWLTRSQDKGGR